MDVPSPQPELTPTSPNATGEGASSSIPDPDPAPHPATDAPIPTPAAAPAPAPASERSWIIFPPFPQPPPGTALVPFPDFKEPGTAHVPADAPADFVEHDGLDIPTVPLGVHHSLTEMEKRKRKTKNRMGPNGIVLRAAWYEEWAEGESFRRTSAPVDPSQPRADRLHSAAYDFKTGRSLTQNTDLLHIWDRFRIFIGLMSPGPSPADRRKTAALRNLAAAQAAAGGGDSEDDEEFDMPNLRPPSHPTAATTATNQGDGEGEGGGEGDPATAATRPLPPPGTPMTAEQRDKLREYRREVRETRTDRFLNNPEETISIFFSGYYRDRGMSGSEKICRDGPILIKFFLDFLLRNRVLPESEKDIRKAVALTEVAKKELPQSIVVSRAFPDAFSKGCELVFGTLTNSMIWHMDSDSEGDTNEGPDAKRQKTSTGDTSPTAVETAFLQSVATDEKIEVITATTFKDMQQDLKDLAADVKKDERDGSPPPSQVPAAAIADEDANASGWGIPGEWNMPTDDNNAFPATDWGTPAADWGSGPTENPLARFLGATTLPLTHTTGVVEHSTRRIKSITFPAAPVSSAGAAKKTKKGGAREPCPAPPLPDAAGVEAELEGRFARAVLVPWEEWDKHALADVRRPRLQPESRGPAIAEPETSVGGERAPGTHDPFRDEIAVLVEPAVAEKMWVGMSVEATWVQLARVDPAVPIELSEENFGRLWVACPKKEPGGPGVPVEPTKLWYMESVRNVLPSFHTEMIPLPTTEDILGVVEED